MKISAEEYDRMRSWLACVWQAVFPDAMLTPATDPIAALDRMAASSPSQARRGLAMAIGDLVEQTGRWSAEQVAEINSRLAQEQLPSLSAVRTKFSKVIKRVVRRRKINDDTEYYAVRNAAESSDGAAPSLWPLLASYEERKRG
jgi:hypothetical protein